MNRTALRQALAAQLHEDTGKMFARLDDDLSLYDGLGLDSVDVITLVLNIETRFGVDLTSRELEKVVKVGDLLDLLSVKLNDLRAAA